MSDMDIQQGPSESEEVSRRRLPRVLRAYLQAIGDRPVHKPWPIDSDFLPNIEHAADEIDRLRTRIAELESVNVVFDGPPGPQAGRFIEVEDDSGRSIRAGTWIERGDGYWSLRIERTPVLALLAALREAREHIREQRRDLLPPHGDPCDIETCDMTLATIDAAIQQVGGSE